jgi:isopenicillin N synthase-like dioxygenase
MAPQQVPTIDIAPFLNGDDETKKEVAELVRQACEDIGFFVITGHGVAPGLTK